VTFFVEQWDSDGNNVERVGQTQTLKHAILLTQAVIDEHLMRLHYKALSANALYTKYQETASMPCIFCDDGEYLNLHAFDSWNYAVQRCLKLCKGGELVLDVSLSGGQDAGENYRHPLSGAEFHRCSHAIKPLGDYWAKNAERTLH
jgi:hypothetical protein